MIDPGNSALVACSAAAAMSKPAPPAFVYRISTADQWSELQRTGSTLGGDLDRSTGCIHLSDLSQVKMTLKNFFLGRNDLYLLQIDASKLADGLIYEASDDNNYFPHFYGPGRSLTPLQLDAVIKADKIELVNSDFTCSLLDGSDLPC